MAGSAVAQPGPRDHRGGQYPPPPQYQGAAEGGRYYYNGRWIDQNEWRRHNAERDRWAHNYQRRRGQRDDNSAALVAGIIGFALGAAIVGSQQQAERARTANQSFDAYCARKYRSYDARSRTYLGVDGLRHYCQ
jgi:hypothetical protein